MQKAYIWNSGQHLCNKTAVFSFLFSVVSMHIKNMKCTEILNYITCCKFHLEILRIFSRPVNIYSWLVFLFRDIFTSLGKIVIILLVTQSRYITITWLMTIQTLWYLLNITSKSIFTFLVICHLQNLIPEYLLFKCYYSTKYLPIM